MADLAAVVDAGNRSFASQLKVDQVVCVRHHGAIRINDLDRNK